MVGLIGVPLTILHAVARISDGQEFESPVRIYQASNRCGLIVGDNAVHRMFRLIIVCEK